MVEPFPFRRLLHSPGQFHSLHFLDLLSQPVVQLPGGLVGEDHTVGDEPDEAASQVLRFHRDFGTDGGSGYKADVPTVPAQDARALVVQFDDGSIHRRLYIPKVEVTEVGDSAVTRNAAQTYALTFTALQPTSGTVLATWFTDDDVVAGFRERVAELARRYA